MNGKDHLIVFWAEGKRYPANHETREDAFAKFATYPVGESGWQAVAILHNGEEIAFKGDRHSRKLLICTGHMDDAANQR